MGDLTAEASALGIQLDYVDARGRRRAVDPADLARIVAALEGHVRRDVTVVRDGGTAVDTLEPDGRLILQAPRTAYRPDFAAAGGRGWLLAVQLYAVRSHRNWGHGDFTDLMALLDIARACGAAGVALNPLHALFPDRAHEASPYSPNSRLFLNPLYIDVSAVAPSDNPQMEIERLRRCDLVDYPAVAKLKLAALRAAHARFRHDADPARRAGFDAYRREAGESLERFAAFEVLRGRFRAPWGDWPQEWRKPSADLVARLRESDAGGMEYHEFAQWVAHSQLRDCAAHARAIGLPVGLYLDLAVGVDPAGADAWSEQDSIVRGLSVGAPADLLNTAGQNWGLASFSPSALIADSFQPLRRVLRALMRFSGAVRIDHVLGINRLFLIPDGFDANHGAYVRFPLEAMLAVIAQESVAARCLVIGEDLGTVPEGFREVLADWSLWSYRLMMFERSGDTFLPPQAYPRDALVAFNTHDLPPFAAWWSGRDLEVKRDLNIDPGESPDERETARRALQHALERDGFSGEPTFDAVARYLARTPSGLLAIGLEDVLGGVDQINVPGTVREHPNWRHRPSVAVEDLMADGRLMRLSANLAAEGRALR